MCPHSSPASGVTGGPSGDVQRGRDHPLGRRDHPRHETLGRGPSPLWTYHGALVDLAVRGAAAELVVATDAAAIHDGLESCCPSPSGGRRRRSRTPSPCRRRPKRHRSNRLRRSSPVRRGPNAVPNAGCGDGGAEPRPAGRGLERPGPHAELAERGLDGRVRQRRLEHLASKAAVSSSGGNAPSPRSGDLGGEVRRIHLEVGRRLTDAGRLARPADVELLTVDELRRCSSGDPLSALPSNDAVGGGSVTKQKGPFHCASRGCLGRSSSTVPHLTVSWPDGQAAEDRSSARRGGSTALMARSNRGRCCRDCDRIVVVAVVDEVRGHGHRAWRAALPCGDRGQGVRRPRRLQRPGRSVDVGRTSGAGGRGRRSRDGPGGTGADELAPARAACSRGPWAFTAATSSCRR